MLSAEVARMKGHCGTKQILGYIVGYIRTWFSPITNQYVDHFDHQILMTLWALFTVPPVEIWRQSMFVIE